MRYAIAMKEEDYGICYWVTRVKGTDNYTMEKEDATTFPDRSSAYCLAEVLGLDKDHEVVPW